MNPNRKDGFFQLLHPVLMKALPLRRSFTLHIEGHAPSDCPCIFTANHFCIHDIPTAAEVIGRHVYVLVSDEDKNTFNGLALSLNGVVWVSRLDKGDRLRARNDLLAHLNAGHSILMYPEATWNLSPNLPMLRMNWGVIGIAKEANVPIVPLYLLFSDDACYAKLDTPYLPDHDNATAIRELRDRMATLCWDLMEKQVLTHREDLGDAHAFLEASIRKRYDEYSRAKKDPCGVRQYEAQFIYTPKSITEHECAFRHLSSIEPNLSNAFLFSRSLSG